MFSFVPADSVIPSLLFTKAELVYAVSVVLADLKDTDDHTKIEMVEMRHFLNQIKDKVVMAAHNGELKAPSFHCGQFGKDEPRQERKPPSISELKVQFPTLSEQEIKEIIDKSQSKEECSFPAQQESLKNKSSREEKNGRDYDSETKRPFDDSHIRVAEGHSPMYDNSKKFSDLLGTL